MGRARSMHGGNAIERQTRRREDNNKMDFREIGWSCVDSIRLAQDKD
jgi:hypothetical protein